MPGQPGIMSVLARGMLARLLARRGQPVEAREVLAAAVEQVADSDDSFVRGPVAAAEVELGWLDGSLGSVTPEVRDALDLAETSRHGSVHAEVCAYLGRADIHIPPPEGPPGPWAPTLAGRWEEAAEAWATLGERYEEGVVLAMAPDNAARARGGQILKELGAVATLVAL
jgi:hypothetical protein